MQPNTGSPFSTIAYVRQFISKRRNRSRFHVASKVWLSCVGSMGALAERKPGFTKNRTGEKKKPCSHTCRQCNGALSIVSIRSPPARKQNQQKPDWVEMPRGPDFLQGEGSTVSERRVEFFFFANILFQWSVGETLTRSLPEILWNGFFFVTSPT